MMFNGEKVVNIDTQGNAMGWRDGLVVGGCTYEGMCIGAYGLFDHPDMVLVQVVVA